MKKRIALIIMLALVVGTAFYVYRGQQKAGSGELSYSGTIEAVQSRLSFQTGGRILKVHVQEGQTVSKDQLLAEIQLDAQKAGLDKLTEGEIDSEIQAYRRGKRKSKK